MSPRVSELVYRFDRPHKVGTVCGFPCDQCGGGRTMILTGANGVSLPDTPMFIRCEATIEDWQRSVRENGGAANSVRYSPFYYFVGVD